MRLPFEDDQIRPMEELSQQRDRIARLLTALVVMLAVLIAGLGAAAGYAFLQFHRARRAVETSPAETVARAAEELTYQQASLAQALEKQVREEKAELASLKLRRKALDEIPGGLVKKSDFALQLAQLMNDEFFMVANHLMYLQESVAKALRPPPAQREAVTDVAREVRTPREAAPPAHPKR